MFFRTGLWSLYNEVINFTGDLIRDGNRHCTYISRETVDRGGRPFVIEDFYQTLSAASNSCDLITLSSGRGDVGRR